MSEYQYYEWQTIDRLLTLADYNGDGLADPAVYDPSSGALALRLSRFSYQLLALPEFRNP